MVAPRIERRFTPMTPERWAQAKTIFGAAIEQEPSYRESYVRAACGSDLALLQEVMSLLQADALEASLHSPLTRPATPPLLKNRYRVERELGRGGLGMVCLARDEALHGRPVVIKLPLDPSPADSWLSDKFDAEVKALALINHPGVVGALDSGVTPDGRPFLVMQYVEGRSLRDAMPRDAGVPLPFAAEVLQQIGQALGAAHAKGIWHRDLKPANIMLQMSESGREYVRLIDFGIASVTQSSGGEVGTRVAGTPPYMATEQLQGRVSASSDIFAMGVIAYELVTGRQPFVADHIMALHELHMAGARKPSQLRPDLPAAADRLILQSLSHRAEERPGNAAAFGEALARALTTTAAPAVQPAKRPTALIAAVALAILLAGGGLIWKMMPAGGRDHISWSLMVQPGSAGPAAPAAPGIPLHTSDGFFLTVRAPQGGYLYLLSDDPAKDSLNTLGSFELRAGEQNRIPDKRPFVFDEPGSLDLWCVWSRDAVPQLEGLAHLLNEQDRGVVAEAGERATTRQFLKTLPQAVATAEQNGATTLNLQGTRIAWRVHVEAK
jgi:hypothetical protein